MRIIKNTTRTGYFLVGDIYSEITPKTPTRPIIGKRIISFVPCKNVDYCELHYTNVAQACRGFRRVLEGMPAEDTETEGYCLFWKGGGTCNGEEEWLTDRLNGERLK